MGYGEPVPAPLPRVEDSEQFKIEKTVYGYLLGVDYIPRRKYSAIFLKGTDAEVKLLMQEFPNHRPPIKPSSEAELRPHATPIDKATGEPAVILSATASEPEGNTAQAVGGYYAGVLFKENYFFKLRKTAGTWTIESVKQNKLPEDALQPDGRNN